MVIHMPNDIQQLQQPVHQYQSFQKFQSMPPPSDVRGLSNANLQYLAMKEKVARYFLDKVLSADFSGTPARRNAGKMRLFGF
jgi:hypothetical protein